MGAITRATVEVEEEREMKHGRPVFVPGGEGQSVPLFHPVATTALSHDR